MAKQTPELERALIAHKAKLTMIEVISEVTPDTMQQVLAIELGNFDKQLESWATTAPIAADMSGYDVDTTNVSKPSKRRP